MTVNELCKGLSGQAHRPDIEAIIVSGLFEECSKGIEAIAAGGTEQLHNVAVYALYFALKMWLNCHSHPKCEARIRSLARALEFCIEHDIEGSKAMCVTTAAIAASIGEPQSLQRLKVSCTCRPTTVHPLRLLLFSVQRVWCSVAMRAALTLSSLPQSWTSLWKGGLPW